MRVRWIIGLCAVALSACLNPMPDDFPNGESRPVNDRPGPTVSPDEAPDFGTDGEQGAPPSEVPLTDDQPDNEGAGGVPDIGADAGVAGDAGPGGSVGRR